jgi:hypothetical protein
VAEVATADSVAAITVGSPGTAGITVDITGGGTITITITTVIRAASSFIPADRGEVDGSLGQRAGCSSWALS